MFPFLSVLCTIIGVMVLFIVLILSTRVIEGEERYSTTQSKTAQGGQVNAKLQGVAADDYTALLAEVERLAAVLKKRRAEQGKLVAKLAALQDLIEFKKTEVLLPIHDNRHTELAPKEPIAVVPAEGFNVKLKPILVEVSAKGYTIHPRKDSFSVIPVSEDDKIQVSQVDAGLKSFLEEIEERQESEYLVFLVHPNGVKAFRSIRQYLVEQHDDINIGWEPFSRDWILANFDN